MEDRIVKKVVSDVNGILSNSTIDHLVRNRWLYLTLPTSINLSRDQLQYITSSITHITGKKTRITSKRFIAVLLLDGEYNPNDYPPKPITPPEDFSDLYVFKEFNRFQTIH